MDKKEHMLFQYDVEVPPVVMEKADEAFLTIKKGGWDTMKENKSVKTGTMAKRTAAAAACAALLVAAGVAGKTFLGQEKENSVASNAVIGEGGGMSSDGDVLAEQDGSMSADGNVLERQDGNVPADGNVSTGQDGNGLAGPDAGTDVAMNDAGDTDFSLSVYAQETRLSDGQNGNLVFTDILHGDGGYTGMLFQVQGEDIADVSISIDKGELYTATVEETTEDAIYELEAQGFPDEDGDPDTHTTYSYIGEPACGDASLPPAKVIAYHCAKGGAKIDGKFDAGLYYGFYIPDDVKSDRYDLAEAHREELGVFDGAVLTVTVTRTDKSSATKEYDLSVKKLALDENREVTQQEWIEGGEGFVYGVLAKKR